MRPRFFAITVPNITQNDASHLREGDAERKGTEDWEHIPESLVRLIARLGRWEHHASPVLLGTLAGEASSGIGVQPPLQCRKANLRRVLGTLFDDMSLETPAPKCRQTNHFRDRIQILLLPGRFSWAIRSADFHPTDSRDIK